MADLAQILSNNGILRPSEVIEIANAEGLELAAACTMLIKESGGGRNVWGSDAVETAGTYTKGGTVTKENYTAYHAAVLAKRAGRQGCGPTQLTYYAFQDQADGMGGCWDWRCNVRVGFRSLAKNIKSGGLRNGFRAYNGSGDAAEKYADASMALYAQWKARLGVADPVSPVGDGSEFPTMREGDTGAAVAALQSFLNRAFPGYSGIDTGPQRYGPQTVAVVKEFQRRVGITGPDADGRTVGPRTNIALARYGYKGV
jgi:hypothetical protein